MIKDPVDIFKDEIFNLVNSTVTVQGVEEGILTIVVKVCNPKWIKVGDNLIHEGLNWAVTLIEGNELTLLKPDEEETLEIGDILTIKAPKFINGTRIVADNEWKLKNNYNSAVGLPLIWLHETIKETFLDEDAGYSREITYRIFLLDIIKHEVLNDVKRAEGVRPMYGLFEEVKRTIETNPRLKRAGVIDVISFSEFGTETEKGIKKRILSENLAGLEVRFDVLANDKACMC